MAVIYLQQPDPGAVFAQGIQQNMQQFGMPYMMKQLQNKQFMDAMQGAQTAGDTAKVAAGQGTEQNPIDITTPDKYSQLMTFVKGGMSPLEAMKMLEFEATSRLMDAQVKQIGTGIKRTEQQMGQSEQLFPLQVAREQMEQKKLSGDIDIQALTAAQKQIEISNAPLQKQLLQATIAKAGAEASGAAMHSKYYQAEIDKIKQQIDTNQLVNKVVSSLLSGGDGTLSGPEAGPGGPMSGTPGMPGAPQGGPASFKPMGMGGGTGNPVVDALEGGPGTPPGNPMLTQAVPAQPQGPQGSGGQPLSRVGGVNLRPGEKAGLALDLLGKTSAGGILATADKPQLQHGVIDLPGGKVPYVIDMNDLARGGSGNPQAPFGQIDTRTTNAPTELLTQQRGLVQSHLLLESAKAIKEAADKGDKTLGGPIVGKIANMARAFGMEAPIGDGSLTANWQSVMAGLRLMGQGAIKGTLSENDQKLWDSTLARLEETRDLKGVSLAQMDRMLTSGVSAVGGAFEKSPFMPIRHFAELQKIRGNERGDTSSLAAQTEQAKKEVTTPMPGEENGGGRATKKDAGAASGVTIGKTFFKNEDIDFTAKKYGISREEVIKKLGGG